MTKVYFVRHALPDFNVHDNLLRPLTQEGTEDSKKVTEFLLNKNIAKVFSSPYKRAVDTIKDFTDRTGLKINIVEDFRERKIDSEWIEDFDKFSEKQWGDFQYKLSDGESLYQVQKRNIAALQRILKENLGENIVIGTHGTALSTIINYYDKNFDYKEFQRIRYYMPFIVCITFDGQAAVKIEEFLLK
ncbi:MAG: histidine phosphatase family protein [Bacillota bacterium]|nr:histidine phosphatase family protein [Bacillota bacterium]